MKDKEEIINELKQECEELKEKLRELELKNTTLQNRNQQLDGAITEVSRYRKAIDKIQRYCTAYLSSPQLKKCDLSLILDIINKAKEDE